MTMTEGGGDDALHNSSEDETNYRPASASYPTANTPSNIHDVVGTEEESSYKSKQHKTYEEHLQDYHHNLLQLQEAHESDPANKYCLIYNAYFRGQLFGEQITSMLRKIQACAGECDFAFSPLIRILYLNQDHYPIEDPTELYSWQERIMSTLLKFPFWPEERSTNMDNLVFWSENHLFMTLSTCYLTHQYHIHVRHEAPLHRVELHDRLETKLLRKYLQVHAHDLFGGVYEVNSHVYLPYTLAALMNLYDFAMDADIRDMAKAVIDKVVYHVMLCTDPKHGIANLTASARAFDRTRQRPWGHNINQLVNVLNGHSSDIFCPTFLSCFLFTTKWSPNQRIFEALYFTGFEGGLLMSHPLSALESIYRGHREDGSFVEAESEHWTPLFWSAGLVVHNLFAKRTRSYQAKFNMKRNQHLWPLSFFFFTDGALRKTMKSYRHFSSGQKYTGIVLNAYKDADHGLVMTSFNLYNPHYCGFQQMPWMINLGGVPVYSRAGLGSESIAGFGIHNTHNPAVLQLGSVMLVSYVTPDIFKSFFVSAVFSHRVHLFLPKNAANGGLEIVELSDHCAGTRQWFVSEHQGCFIAACFTTKNIRTAPGDDKDAFFQAKPNGPKLKMDKIYTDDKRVSIVLACGTKTHFKSLDDFILQRVRNIIVLESVGENKMYSVMVHDPWEKRDGVDATLRYECNKDSPYTEEEN